MSPLAQDSASAFARWATDTFGFVVEARDSQAHLRVYAVGIELRFAFDGDGLAVLTSDEADRLAHASPYALGTARAVQRAWASCSCAAIREHVAEAADRDAQTKAGRGG